MNLNPVDQWTNTELARWMAERDGYVLSGPKCTWFNQHQYPYSLDAAVAWIERRGFEWTRTSKRSVQVYKNSSYISEWATESPDCPTARALCIAAVKAQMDVEAQNG